MNEINNMSKIVSSIFFLLLSVQVFASSILIPMDADTQKNHLKAYGITYWVLSKQQKVQWLLNYRGGSFLLPDGEGIRKECQIRGVSFEIISDSTYTISQQWKVFNLLGDGVAAPSAFIIGKNNAILWGHRGSSPSDRPPTDFLLAKTLDLLEKVAN